MASPATVPAPVQSPGTDAQSGIYTPPSIPSSFRESFSAWLKSRPARDGADAEIHLYKRHTPYFNGATVGNVRNGRIDRVWRDTFGSKDEASSGDDARRSIPNRNVDKVEKEKMGLRATMGTRLNSTDGKVGFVHLVDIDRDVPPTNSTPVSSSSSSTSTSSASSPTGTMTPSAPSSGFLQSLWASKAPRQINTLEIGSPHVSPDATPEEWAKEQKVVLLHGYGAGTSFFFQNIKALAEYTPAEGATGGYTSSRLFALDWLGMGRSARVPFHVPKNGLPGADTGAYLGAGDHVVASNNCEPNLSSSASASRSSSPSPVGTAGAEESDIIIARTLAAESFFIDSLESWRQAMRIERMTIIGHSLGGYLSLAYALKYPHRVERVVCVSPAGIGSNPNEPNGTRGTFAPKNLQAASREDLTQSPAIGLKQMQEQQQQVEDEGIKEAIAEITGEDSKRKSIASARAALEQVGVQAVNRQTIDAAAPCATTDSKVNANASLNAGATGNATGSVPASASTLATDQKPSPPPRIGRRTRALFTWLWDQNISPFALIRSSAFFGPMLTGRYTRRRFGALQEEDLRALHAYSHAIFSSKGSSEYCLSYILAPGAFARYPMLYRLAPLRMPVSFIYGRRDWMDVAAGRLACRALADAGNKTGSCFVVPDAGHHVYLDNPKATDTLLSCILKGEVDGRI
ncbi:alpha/beta-hydrolase [Tilletiaria anomala UBC 951]|uniref:Alpha/beta-hydrolase n=1 Tax=Tilletiaria anomala (strain ATCC 24038 / CBS 436.72 / UBC 951) TaxID=1037660 RepID=A0A066VE63_TILAU|nr:alpha/beta-hydrolase [Tilletiaria anomala UBC 951]KDN39751.1 alpha/beta-hydrolase [Tilletiaria anomala UBC 951]